MDLSKHIIIVFILFLSIGCVKNNSEEEKTAETEVINFSPQDITHKAMASADSLMTCMTLEERIGQCLMPSIMTASSDYNLNYLKKLIDDYHIGGVVLLQGDTLSAKKISTICESSKIPLFIAIDAEWGLGMRLRGASLYPRNGNLDKDLKESFLFDYGRQIAIESRLLGINMILGPVVDITTSRHGVIGNRSFGGNPVLVSEYGVAYAKGLESGGIVSVAKHFPGHGSARHDSHIGVATNDKSITFLDSVDLKPFRDYIDSGLSGVMAGHIKAKSLDPDGNAATVSIDILTNLLRNEMGFKGLILTDAFDMGGAKGFSASDALNAGADIILCPSDIRSEYTSIYDNISKGSLPVSILNERCRRILFYKYLFHLFPD